VKIVCLVKQVPRVAGGAEMEQRADVVFRGDPDEVIRPLTHER
jgi:hypothetical protein